MERNKYPYSNIGKQKDSRINLKDNSPYTSDSNTNQTKNTSTNSNNDKVFKDIKKNLAKNDALKPSQSCTELKSYPTDKKVGLNNKKNTTSFIEEKRIKYNPNKSKNRSMEKVPSSNIESNKKDWKRNNNNGDKHNSCGKNSDYNKYNKTETKKNIRINKRNFNTIEYNNIDDLQNININEEQSIKNRNKNKKNNYLNYIITDSKVNNDPNLITKSDLDDTEDENPYSFKEYNSFCVRINNNYNYNVSLGNNSDFINQAFDKKKDDLPIKNKGKEGEWKEKITKINKQKNDINYGDYKKASNKDSNLKKTKKNLNKEDKNVTNKTIDSNNTTSNLKQKIKKLNSAVIPGESDKKMNISDNEAASDKKNEPKKYTGILGFLRTFKDMVKPFNMRKKTNYENESDSENSNNSIENSNKIEIKEKANKSDNNTIVSENKKKRYIFNFLNSNENISNNVNINNNSKKPENTKANIYEKKSLSKKIEDINYYSDSGYESSPLPHKPKNLNMYSTPNLNIAKRQNVYESKNSQQILSYSQKSIMKLDNNNNENVLYEGKKSRQMSDIVDKNYNDYKTEEKPKGNNIFNLYGIFNNKLYQKTLPNQSNKTNNIINDFYRNNINIPKQLNDTGYNSAYAKKTKKIFPSINNNDDAISEKEIRKYSFHNNNTAYNLNKIDKENMNNPVLNNANDANKYNTKNINENLNINAEKKIQEIKININYKGNNNNFNNTLTPVKNQNTNNYGNLDDFVSTPKPKSEIETCVINFKQNKKPMKVYENNLYNNTNANINDQNISNNNNYSLYKNNTNIKDINNNNSKNIYSKPMGKNLNFSQGNSLSEKNIMDGKKENILSYSDTNIALNRNNFDSPKPSLKKNIIHKNERIVNRLANSTQFDNDTNSVNSGSCSNNDLNKTTIFPSSNITNSIYFKPFKYFFGGNKNKTNNSANNSFSNTLFRRDNINDGNLSDRESNTNSGLNKIIYFNKRNKTSQLINNENNVNQNNKLNPEKMIYRKSNSNKNNNFKINLISNNNNNNVIAINNITPMVDNTNCIVNNIKTIIRPKVIQKKTEFIEKYYSYYKKNPIIEKESYFFSKEYIKDKIYKLPLKKISFYTKSYCKIIQKPKMSQHYIDKKRITHKRAIALPIIENCTFTKENVFEKGHKEINENKFSTPNQKKEIREQNMTPKFKNNNQNYSSNREKNKIISIEIDLNNKNKYIKKNKDLNNEENANVSHNLASTYNKIHLNTNANEPLYIKKTPNNKAFKQSSNNINNNYVHTEDDNFKIYLQERMNDNLKINKFFSDDFNINNNLDKPTNNKIISIDIDLRKEQKKLQEQREIKTYKKPTTVKPLMEQNQNFKNKINTIKINLNKNNSKNINTINKYTSININDKYVNNSNNDKFKQEIIYKLDIIETKNLMIIIDELIDLLTKKVVINNVNDNINLNKIRLSFIEIINNSYLFVEIIINKVISEIKKVDIYAQICYEISMRMNNEVSFGGNGTNEDLKTILQESCKIKFEEIVIKDISIEDNKNNLIGIVMFICELINYKIIFIDTGFLCFEKLCNKYNDCLYENGKLNKYYYLDLIINLLNKIGKNAYQIKDLKYKERIDNYINNELNNLINNDMGLPEYLRNKIINLIKAKKNNWNF